MAGESLQEEEIRKKADNDDSAKTYAEESHNFDETFGKSVKNAPTAKKSKTVELKKTPTTIERVETTKTDKSIEEEVAVYL